MTIDYFVGDQVIFRDRQYFIVGIRPESKRPIALGKGLGNIRNIENDFGLVTLEDIELSQEGEREYGPESRQAMLGYSGIQAKMTSNVGIGEDVDGVFPMVDEHGFVVYDHDGIEQDPFNSPWNSPEAVNKRYSKAQETTAPKKPAWDHFKA